MTRTPNLVFIFSDQQRADTMACYGNDWLNVPNLNALAAQSFVFQNAYVTQPVCTPARASIMTGLYPHAANMPVNQLVMSRDIPVIAEMLPAEYHCGYYGKWHLGDDVIRQHGFDEWVSTEDGHLPEYTRREYRNEFSDYWHHLVDNGFEPDLERMPGKFIFSPAARSRLPEEFQMASFLGDRAADFIERNSDQPFALYVSTFEPHPPYNGPLNDMYDPATLPVGPAFLQRPDGASMYNRVRGAYYTQYMYEGGDPAQDPYMSHNPANGQDLTTELGWRTLRAHYLANITLVDRMVAKITDALDKAGVADNTIVVFTSEHGEMAGDHGMLEKRSFYEEASRVPLTMRVPWLSREQTMLEGSASHIDLVPTLLDLMGQTPPPHLQGKSLALALTGERDLSDNEVIIQWNGNSERLPDRFLGSAAINRMNALPRRCIITPDRWKLALCAGDAGELFDLNADPYEMNNLFADPAQRDRVIDMAVRIRIWQQRAGDDAPLPSV